MNFASFFSFSCNRVLNVVVCLQQPKPLAKFLGKRKAPHGKTLSCFPAPGAGAGRHTGGRDPLTLFYTASGIECLFTGSELHLCLNAGFDLYEPWISVELNGAWIARFPVPAGESEVCLFRGMTPGRVKLCMRC